MYIAWNIFIINCGNWPVHSRCTALKEGLYRLYGFLESAWNSLVSKKSWWKTLNFLRQCFQISRGQIWGWVSLILSEVIIPSYYCLFFFLTYYYIFFIFPYSFVRHSIWIQQWLFRFAFDNDDLQSDVDLHRSLRYTEIGQISRNKHMYFKNIKVNFSYFVFYLSVSFNPSWPSCRCIFRINLPYKFVEAKSRSFDLFP